MILFDAPPAPDRSTAHDMPSRRRRGAARGLLIACLSLAIGSSGTLAQEAPATPPETAPGTASGPRPQPGKDPTTVAPAPDAAAMAHFLNRLMMAESGGRDQARNPRSTAVGPFQFIESTFLSVVRRHFAAETGELSGQEILRLRTSRAFAWRAAEAFTRDNAAILASAGLDASFANLRLAHLVGPGGAVRVLKAPETTLAAALLGGAVARANPFLGRMTVADLVQWSARNLAAPGSTKIAADPSRVANARTEPAAPAIRVRCNRSLASCRRWVALAKTRAVRKERVAGAGTKRRR